MKPLVLSLVLLFGVSAHAEDPSKKIAQAVRAFAPLAESGVSEYKVEAGQSTRGSLLELALQEQIVDSEEDFDWAGDSWTAWSADSQKWGSATMKDAYNYITDLEDSDREVLDEEGNEAKKAAYERNLKKAKDAFELLVGTGVKFGVAPMGAVQCGVTFAALAIIDPRKGKVYIFRREGSGC